jgi:CBS domain-containing protein
MTSDHPSTVGDIMMKGPVTLKCDDILDLADDVMNLGRIRHLPIVEGKRLVGIVSQRDLFRSALAGILGWGHKTRKTLLKTIQIKEIMSTPVVTVSPDTPVRDAARLMMAKKIGCLPVVDGERLVGLVTETDMLRYVVEH